MKKKILIGLGLSIVVSLVIGTLLLIKKVVIEIDGQEKVIYTLAKDYETMLRWHFIEVLPEDEISVGLGTAVKKNYKIVIKKAQEITIEVDNKVINHKTTKDYIGQVLEELNITIDDSDKISKALNDEVVNGDNIIITRVKVNEEIVTETLEFNSKTVKDYKTYVGGERIISQGKEGQKSYYYTVTYENGKEVNRVFEKEEISLEPIDYIVGEGVFDPNSITVCVNKNRYLPAEFVPENLVTPNVRLSGTASNTMMKQEAATALESLFNGAEVEGLYFYALSGYRSYYTQQSIYNPYSGYSAPPGASEHQLGLAMDVTSSYYGAALVTNFAYTTEGQWLKANAHKYGFVIRYMEGKEDITGYYYEPWHIRYLGIELATELFNRGITLEEYYGEY